MNRILLLSAAALGAMCPLAATAQSTAGPAQPPGPSAISTARMLEAYGWFLGQQMELYSFAFNDAEIAALSRGIGAAAKGQEASSDLEEVGAALQQFLQSRPAEVQQRRLKEGQDEEAALFARIDGMEAVKKTAKGLRYEIIAPGTGEKPALSSTVVAHYTGTFVDGRVFDSSQRRGQPAEFPLNGVIEGWQEGLQLIGVGGRIKLYIPGSMAYGDTGRMNIPPAKALLFDVELLEVKPGSSEASPQP